MAQPRPFDIDAAEAALGSQKTEAAREAVRKESQRSETGTQPPPGVTSRKAMLCKERGAPSGTPCTQRIWHRNVQTQGSLRDATLIGVAQFIVSA
jgi:hypothetical protein